MSDAIETVDVTERAAAGGWKLPEGWKVKADISPDLHTGDPGEEYDSYTPAQVAAWKNDEWSWVVVSVWVEDPSGREWGRDVLGACEYGTFTLTDEDDNVTGSEDINPLSDDPGSSSVIREHDMIGEALRDAVRQLAAFGTPVIVEPGGATVTGL